MIQIAALRSRLEKQPTGLRRNPRDLGDGALGPSTSKSLFHCLAQNPANQNLGNSSSEAAPQTGEMQGSQGRVGSSADWAERPRLESLKSKTTE
jgi:hypothetical protein